MPCCIVLLALAAPRFAILLVVLFSDYIGTAYQTLLVPFLGFLFLPLTALTYAWAIHSNGSIEGIHLAVVVVAALMDMGILGGSARGPRANKGEQARASEAPASEARATSLRASPPGTPGSMTTHWKRKRLPVNPGPTRIGM